jgi:hypothetical protein
MRDTNPVLSSRSNFLISLIAIVLLGKIYRF